MHPGSERGEVSLDRIARATFPHNEFSRPANEASPGAAPHYLSSASARVSIPKSIRTPDRFEAQQVHELRFLNFRPIAQAPKLHLHRVRLCINYAQMRIERCWIEVRMNSRNSRYIRLTPGAIKGLRALILIAAFAMLAGACLAATPAPTKASLDGTYVFHFSTVKEVNWSNSVSCHYTNATYTYTGYGQSVDDEVITGEAIFDGKGGVVIHYTDNRKFDQAASDDTVSITCPSQPGGSVNTNNGHMVLYPTTSGTYTGTYSVSSDGSAAITLPAVDGGLTLNLSAFNSAGVSTTFLIDTPDGTDDFLSGIGVLK
jgi:hypothetical protein